MPVHRFTAEEVATYKKLAEELGISDFALNRNALRHYQVVCERIKAGETFHFSGDEERAREFAGLPSKKLHYYIDFEFDGHNGPVLSFAIVSASSKCPWYVIVENQAKR